MFCVLVMRDVVLVGAIFLVFRGGLLFVLLLVICVVCFLFGFDLMSGGFGLVIQIGVLLVYLYLCMFVIGFAVMVCG